MRKTFIITLFLYILFVSTGLDDYVGGRDEIESLYYITMAGIDKNNDGVKVTISTSQTESENGGEKPKNIYYTSEGKTLFDANRNFNQFMLKDIFWGNVDTILISEKIAKENISGYLDFFLRDHELRIITMPFIIKGYSAEEAFYLVTKANEDIHTKINHMVENVGTLSKSSKMTLVEVINSLHNKNYATHIPAIIIVEDIENEYEKEENPLDEPVTIKSNIFLDGYAFFDQESGESIGYLHDTDARGFNYVMNKVKSGSITVHDSHGKKIGLEIIESKADIKAEYKEDKIKITIEIIMSSNIVEQLGVTDIYTKRDIDFLIKQQDEIVKNEVNAAIEFARSTRNDIFNISDIVNHKYPIKYNKIQDKWRDVFDEIEFEVKVESNVNRVYSVKEPTRSE